MNLLSYPHLVKEWHPTKNGELTPNEVTHGSSKKVWWLCSKGHSYDSAISNRAKEKKPTGCPYCSRNKVGEDNNLLYLFPELAKECGRIFDEEVKEKMNTFEVLVILAYKD